MTEIGYGLAAALARQLPRRLLAGLVDALAEVYVLTHPRRARAVDRNLSRLWRAAGGRGSAPRARDTARVFGRALLDFLAQPPRDGTALPTVRLSDEARRALALARSSGAPTVLVSGHFGPWERALQWLAAEIGPLDALAAPHRLGAVERFFQRRRAAFGVGTVPADRAAAAALGRLRAGVWIAALVDRGPDRRAGEGAAPGRGIVPLASGPLRLARRAGADVLPGVTWLEADGTLGVRFDPPFALEPRRDGIPLAQALERLQRFFDDHVRSHPTQWFEWRALTGASG